MLDNRKFILVVVKPYFVGIDDSSVKYISY